MLQFLAERRLETHLHLDTTSVYKNVYHQLGLKPVFLLNLDGSVQEPRSRTTLLHHLSSTAQVTKAWGVKVLGQT